MSDKKIFIHIPKNAGTTIRLNPILQDKIIAAGPEIHKSKEYSDAVRKKMKFLGDHHGFEHARWRDLNPDITSQYQAFAVVRNPWDRVVSRYLFAKKIIEVEYKSPSTYADVSSFEAFLDERYKWGNMNYMWHRAIRGWFPAVDYVTDVDGNLKCDILSFENFDQDICDYFDLESPPQARNVTGMNEGSYKDLYDDNTIAIVADWYKSDIDMFGYDFDTGPTKNTWRLLNE